MNEVTNISLIHDSKGNAHLATTGPVYDWVGGRSHQGFGTRYLSSEEIQELFGDNFVSVIDRLYLIENTFVGELLMSSIQNLSYSYEAAYRNCGLCCRNVILDLGRTLFPVSQVPYKRRNDTSLDIKPDKTGQKEKNRLKAYIDTHYKEATPDNHTLLEKAECLVNTIYNKGSGGKGSFTRQEAQDILSNTFLLVDILYKLCGLKPSTITTS